ncbi:PadR family transcriptional regulator [Ferroacidibacillus organovorans]|uniref:PadR family transcriptional regulator n=1 Tax=Ferroacidibacillus organovorans TaxID=1765683 RepID=UPI001F42E688|nr:PadR family transcriptional regulator [Ferroacidibacillus organovorans]
MALKTANILPLTEAFYYILLSLYAGSAHGYAIMQKTQQISDKCVNLGAGTLYTALSTLLKKGLIELSDGPQKVESRRKVYAITPDGLTILRQELHRLERLVENGHRVINKMKGEEL